MAPTGKNPAPGPWVSRYLAVRDRGPDAAADCAHISGQDTRESVLDFIDNLFVYLTVSGFSEFGVFQRVLPLALCGTADGWRRLLPTFQFCNQFIAAFREESLPVAYAYRIRLQLDARSQHPEEGLRGYVQAMQELFYRADPTTPETIEVSHVMR